MDFEGKKNAALLLFLSGIVIPGTNDTRWPLGIHRITRSNDLLLQLRKKWKYIRDLKEGPQ